MELKDLRIGNIVCLIDRTQQIHMPIQVAPMFVWIIEPFEVVVRPIKYFNTPYLTEINMPDEFKMKGCDVTGIPINEEWLKKLGGKAENHIKGETQYSLNGYIDVYCYEGKFTFEPTSTRINYVHELQNIYFALTGKELEYNKK